MKIKINLPIRAKSSQDKRIVRFGKRFALINSKSTLSYKSIVLGYLMPFTEQSAILKSMFEPRTHELFAYWTFQYNNLYTKQGVINSRCADLGNDIKCVQDIILNKFIGIDDKYITYEHPTQRVMLVKTDEKIGDEPGMLLDGYGLRGPLDSPFTIFENEPEPDTSDFIFRNR